MMSLDAHDLVPVHQSLRIKHRCPKRLYDPISICPVVADVPVVGAVAANCADDDAEHLR
ncbi:hypothetical protein ACFV24_02430 [Nocardia fluminea]